MKKGFTLVEVMIAISILGLLISIGVPGFVQARKESKENNKDKIEIVSRSFNCSQRDVKLFIRNNYYTCVDILEAESVSKIFVNFLNGIEPGNRRKKDIDASSNQAGDFSAGIATGMILRGSK